MSKYKHIFWDWNGTIIDDAALCVKVTNILLERRNTALIDLHIYLEKFTFPVINFYHSIGFDFSQKDYPEVAHEWIREYKKLFYDNSKLNGDIIGALELIQNKNITQSILSACETTLLNHSIDHLNLRPYFKDIHGTDNVRAHGKVELAKSIITQLHCEPHEALLFGDTIHDYEVAQEIGIDCVLIAQGHQSKERLQSCGATVIPDISLVHTVL